MLDELITILGWQGGTKYQVLDEVKKLVKKDCTWTEDHEGIFETTCKNAFSFVEESIKENGFVYCPYCGGKIK